MVFARTSTGETMSTSIVHILTVIGKGAEQVEAACDELLGRRVPADSIGYGSDDWSETDHKDIEHLCRALMRGARKLPILYNAQYLDSWSIGSSQFRLLDWPDHKERLICGANFNLAYYPGHFSQDLLTQIKNWRRKRVYRIQAEDRWYLDHVREAMEVARWLDARSVVVSIDELIGASRLDVEIKESLQSSIDLSKTH
jgi:hypothetical protein